MHSNKYHNDTDLPRIKPDLKTCQQKFCKIYNIQCSKQNVKDICSTHTSIVHSGSLKFMQLMKRAEFKAVCTVSKDKERNNQVYVLKIAPLTHKCKCKCKISISNAKFHLCLCIDTLFC